MREKTIDELVDNLKWSKENNKPAPIFLLGAGASVTGEIPLANEIVKKILEDYKNHSSIKYLKDEEKNYQNIMSKLTPNQIIYTLKDYLERAKINTTHLYLANLLKNEYVDYIFTTNFDNLLIRALALYNIFPPIYDIASIIDLTTTAIKPRSISYLHGLYPGIQLLNSLEKLEDEKIKQNINNIFRSVTDNRPWIVIGYSGNDPVFDRIKELGNFDNFLYWLPHKNENPKNEKVLSFLKDKHRNAFLIKENDSKNFKEKYSESFKEKYSESFKEISLESNKGYDADSFMMELNKRLGLEQPLIIDKPFSALNNILKGIIDINDKKTNERFKIAKSNVKKSIYIFEEGVIKIDDKTLKLNLLKKQIIDLNISNNFDEEKVTQIVKESEKYKPEEINDSLSSLYFNWAKYLKENANKKDGKEAEDLFKKAIEKYEKAIELKPDDDYVYYNLGNALSELAYIKAGKEAEELLIKTIEKYEKAIKLKPNDFYYYNFLGNTLSKLAKYKVVIEAEDLLIKAIKKYENAIEIKPDDDYAYCNLGNALSDIARKKEGKEKEELLNKAIEKYKKAIELKPDDYYYYLLGNALSELAKLKERKEAEDLLKKAIEKYEKAIELKPDDYFYYYLSGNILLDIANNKEGNEADELIIKAIEKYLNAIELNPNNNNNSYYFLKNALSDIINKKEGKEAENLLIKAEEVLLKAIKLGAPRYNLACLYSLKKNKNKALELLDFSLKNKEVTKDQVLNDLDWEHYLNDEDFKNVINKY